MYAHIDTYNTIRLQAESKRVSRTLKGTERTEANARVKRLTMAQLGLSSTNLVFDSKLAADHLDPEILEILKNDPDKDDGIMYTRVPVEQVEANGLLVSYNQLDCLTSGIAESDNTGGKMALDTDSDDDDQYSFITGFELSELDHLASGSERVISRLPYFIHDLKRWQGGFKPSKFYKAEDLRKRKAYAAAFPEDKVNPKTLNIITRKRRVARLPQRKHAVSKGLPAK